MKIDKVIFGVDDNPLYQNFWPIQSKIIKKLFNAQPVLFHITNEDSDFYDDGNGIVKKINRNNCPGIITSFLSQIVRMYGTKYFPNDVCMTNDIDMIIINRDWFIDKIKEIDDNSLVILDEDAYSLERPECQNHNEPCENRYPICYNIGKGSTFNKILDTDRPFSQYAHELGVLKLGWGTDEIYFGQNVNENIHGVEIHKFKRGYSSPWKAEKRINRHNFPVILNNNLEITAQLNDGVFDWEKLKNGYYIDAHCPRPYIEYKKVIDNLVEISLSITNPK